MLVLRRKKKQEKQEKIEIGSRGWGGKTAKGTSRRGSNYWAFLELTP